MRIIPDDAQPALRDRLVSIYSTGKIPVYDAADTIEITDDEWDEIVEKYFVCVGRFDKIGFKYSTFSQYLRELIKLKEAKA